MTHPLALLNNTSGFQDTQEQNVRQGDRVFYSIDMKYGVLDEALHDGDAFVTWDDGSFGTVKWNHLLKVPE